MRKISQAPGVRSDSRTEFMLVNCPRCGRANDASQNFCGICGAPLRKSDQSSTPPLSFSEQSTEGFTFLGLNESSESPDFLLTEVKGGGAGRTLVVLLLFLVVGASFMWLWRHEAAWRGTWLEERLRSVISRPSNALPGSSDSVSQPEDASTPSNAIEDSGERIAPNDSQNADAQAHSPVQQSRSENAGEPAIEGRGVTSDRSSQNNDPGMMPHESPARQPDQSNSEPDTLAAEGQKYLYSARGPQDCRRA